MSRMMGLRVGEKGPLDLKATRHTLIDYNLKRASPIRNRVYRSGGTV